MTQTATTEIQVWDVNADAVITVSPLQAFAGMMTYAASLGPGTPAAAVATRRALRFAQDHGIAAGPYTEMGD